MDVMRMNFDPTYVPPPAPAPAPPAPPPPSMEPYRQMRTGVRKEKTKPCKECNQGKPCEKPVLGHVYNYGCWCGPSIAPALYPKDREAEIPQDPEKWGKWSEEAGMPAPRDGVDQCCKIHDLELGALRKSAPENAELGAFSTNAEVSAIHKRLADCFRKQRSNMDNDRWGRGFANRAAPFFDFMAWKTAPPVGLTGADSTMGIDPSFGNASAMGGSNGAGQTFFP